MQSVQTVYRSTLYSRPPCQGGSQDPGGGGVRATAAATLALMDPEWGTKMPLFIMAPGALATFSGSDLCHGTTEHDDVRSAEAPPPLLV